MRELPVNPTPPCLLREGGAASESPKIYDLIKESVGLRHARHLSGSLVWLIKEIFLAPSKYLPKEARKEKQVLMLLGMATGDQSEPINQSKVSAASISYFNLLLSAVLEKYLWLK